MLDSIVRLEQGGCALSCVNTTTARVDPIQSAYDWTRVPTLQRTAGEGSPSTIRQRGYRLATKCRLSCSNRSVRSRPAPPWLTLCAELLVFLTPRVIRHWRDARDVSEEPFIGFVGCEGAVAGRPR